MATIKHSIIIPASSQDQQVDFEIPITVTVTAIGTTSTTTSTTKASTTTTTTKAVTTTTTTKAPSTTTTTTKVASSYLTLPLSGARDISGQSNVVIENLRFENTSVASLKVWNANNITIRNCFFNKSAKEAIDMQNSNNVTITNCLFNHVESGVYALNCQTIKINNNQFVNVRKRVVDGGGRGQFVQFNSCGGAGNEIMNNRGENFPGESDPEDLISMYNSSGTAASPILIKGNMFRGGGPSGSGGGIMAGDGGGNYQTADSNTLLDPGQYGMAASGGNNIQIINNKIFARQQSFTNNPLYVANYSGKPCGSAITVKGNRVNWTDKDGNLNGGWNSGDCGVINWEDPTTITQAELGVPAHLITFVTPEELIQIRK